jgi:hypothetical protein
MKPREIGLQQRMPGTWPWMTLMHTDLQCAIKKRTRVDTVRQVRREVMRPVLAVTPILNADETGLSLGGR